MEIRTLRYFLAVAREENMTRAAELLHVTQPTLSRALRSLEEELGKKLFTRHSFHISLTEEGMLLRQRAEDLLSMADKIEKEFYSLDDVSGGELFLGLAESCQIRYLARELKSLKRSCPALRYHLTSGDTEQVTEKLDRGLLDFAVLCEEPDAQVRLPSLPGERHLGTDPAGGRRTGKEREHLCRGSGGPAPLHLRPGLGGRHPTLGRGGLRPAAPGGLLPTGL